MMLRKLFYPHSLIVTGLMFVLIWLLNIIRINAHFLNPFRASARNYEITDLVYSRLWDAKVSLDKRIVLVNTGRPNRDSLWRVVDRVREAGAKVIGIDLLLSERMNPGVDSALQKSFQRTKNLVLAVELEALEAGKKLYEAPRHCDTFFCHHAQTGFINFIASDSTTTIRFFSPREMTATGPCLSFGAQTAKLYDPKAVDLLFRRNKKVEEIYYAGNQDQFVQFEFADILDSTADLRERFQDKIVLIGFLGAPAWGHAMLDLHYTPLNARYTGYNVPDMYGMVVHANIIQMILDRHYLKKIPAWLQLLLTFSFCYLNIHVYYRLFRRVSLSYRYLIRFLQLSEILVLFFVVAALFHFFRIKMEVGIWITSLILTFEVVKIYDKILRKKIGFLKRIPDEFPSNRRIPKKTPQKSAPLETTPPPTADNPSEVIPPAAATELPPEQADIKT